MKTVRLSSAGERISAWAVTAVIMFLIVMIFCVLGKSSGYYVLMFVCSLFAFGMVLLYLAAVIRAAAVPAGSNKLKIYGLISGEEDYSGAVWVKTVPVEIGVLRSRAIEFCNAEGETVCRVSTMFTQHEGVMAEPAAMELAEILELEFIPTVEKWKYDRNAIAEHKAKLRLEKNAKRAHRRKAGSSADEYVGKHIEEQQDEINFDAMDDER